MKSSFAKYCESRPANAAALCCIALTAGCASQSNTFRFTADLPPNFAYQAVAVYVPAKGETCSVPGGRNTEVGFNLKWREKYTRESVIALQRTVSGCPLVIARIRLEINASYGKSRGDFGGGDAMVVIRDELEQQYKRTFNEVGESSSLGSASGFFAQPAPSAASSNSSTARKSMPWANRDAAARFRCTRWINCRARP